MHGRPAPRRGALPAKWVSMAAIMATSSLVGMIISFSVPLLSLILEQRGVAPALIGINAAATGIAVFAVAPWLPTAVRRLGPVASMVAGGLLCIACFMLLPLKVDPLPWFVLRFLIGLGIVLGWVASSSAVSAMADETNRGRVMGLYGTLFSVGYAAGPALIGVTGSEGLLPFVVCVVLLGLGLLPLGLVRGASQATGGPDRLGLLAILRLAPLPLGAVLLFGLLETACFAFLPIYGLRIGYPLSAAALLLTVLVGGGILFQLPIGWLADQMSHARLLIGLVVVTLLLVLLWPFAVPHRVLAWPLLTVTGGVVSGLYTVSLIVLGQRFHGAELATAYTMLVMMYQLGAISGPTLAGIAIGAVGIQGLPVVLAIAPALLLAAGIGVRLRRRSVGRRA